MRFVLSSSAKLNLSLRVTSRRSDGYHDIVSLFLRLPSVETIFLSEAGWQDSVHVRSLEIEGENIVARALRCARAEGKELPFCDVEIVKTLYPGSGLGAGSGNGAAVLRWFAGKEDDPAWRRAALNTGADVPFLFSGVSLALVSGIGEILEPREPFPLYAVVVFPDWSTGTTNAYGELDLRYGEKYPLDGRSARAEAEELYQKLRDGERIGLLPNDFAPFLMEKFPDYGKLFEVFDRNGSRAWGITGSGSAAFALFDENPQASEIPWSARIRQIVQVELR